ncbi:hypothetical protein CLU79DRAFT_739410 [Phycomyces nitens]|nr:hypothetical protein CLU79DRAFT_739410 [Phycomyces nitens]
MSVLQSTSLFMLHKQTTAFSIKDGQGLLSKGIKAILTEDLKQLGEATDITMLDDGIITVIFMLLGTIASLLIGTWADYNAHSTTQWLVLSWILSPISFVVIFFFIMCTSSWEENWDSFLILFCISCIPSIGCLIAATIIGYLPK